MGFFPLESQYGDLCLWYRHSLGYSVFQHCKGLRFKLLYVPFWCWLDLSCSLFLHLVFHSGSGMCFRNMFPTFPHLPCFGSCTWRTCEVNLFWVPLNTKMHLRGAADAGQLLAGVWSLGQKKACSEYMALPHSKIGIVWILSTLYSIFYYADLITSGHAAC